MALLWIEGFDAFGVTDSAAASPTGIIGRKYSVATEASCQVRPGRFGGHSLLFTNGNSLYPPPPLTTEDTVVFGCSTYGMTGPLSSGLVGLYDGTTQGINIGFVNSTTMYINRGGTTLETFTVPNMALTWHFVELKVKCNGVSGTYEVRIDGVNVASDTGLNTQAGANAYHTTFRLQTTWGGGYASCYDDLYFLDSSGSVNTDFLGVRKVTTLFPTDVGSDNDWTGSAEVDHYTLVDENPCDDDTTYVESSTSTDKELWTFDTLTDVGIVSGIQVNTDCRETDATPFSIKTVVKTLSESDDAGQVVGTSSYTTRRRLLETDPYDSEAWSASRINDAQFGIKVV